MLKELLQGRFLKHPLHPIFVHLPVGLWIFSLLLDGYYFYSHSRTVAAASLYCMGGGLIGSLLAFPSGLADYLEIPLKTLQRRTANIHFLLNGILFFTYLFNFISRRISLSQSQDLISPLQLTLSIIGVIILSISGYFGGRLVYFYGIGFRPQDRPSQKDSNQDQKAA
jgi:uncharacterized membrane protein